MNRMFDDMFREFISHLSGRAPGAGRARLPQIDIDETDKEVRITAELPDSVKGRQPRNRKRRSFDLRREENGIGDKARRFSERYYGRFVRRIPRCRT